MHFSEPVSQRILSPPPPPLPQNVSPRTLSASGSCLPGQYPLADCVPPRTLSASLIMPPPTRIMPPPPQKKKKKRLCSYIFRSAIYTRVNANIAKCKVILPYVMDGRRWMVFVVMRMREYKRRVDWYLSSS